MFDANHQKGSVIQLNVQHLKNKESDPLSIFK